MATDHIRYDVLARDALRGVLRKVLTDAASHGLPGEHHCFITFVWKAEGVKLSSRLLAQYPEEMTIILQHQFWDLTVLEDRFEVGLSFGGIPERLIVPFSAIKSFLDPSVKFGLQFDTSDVAEVSSETLPAAPAPSAVAVPAPAAALAPLAGGAAAAFGAADPAGFVARPLCRAATWMPISAAGFGPWSPALCTRPVDAIQLRSVSTPIAFVQRPSFESALYAATYHL